MVDEPINAINVIETGGINIYTAEALTPADIDLNEDITSSSGDNTDELGGGEIRIVTEGIINMNANMAFRGADAHLILAADNIYNTTHLTNKIITTVGGLTVLTRTEGVLAGSEIIVEETDSLVVYGLNLSGTPAQNPVGLSSAHGIIDVRLFAVDARLTLHTGSIITRDSGMDITLRADDFDFLPAPVERDSNPERPRGGVIGTGELTLVTSNATNFALGTAAEHKLGNDWTDIRSKFPAFVAYPWWVGGGFSGEDNSAVWDGNGDTLFTNTVHLSTRDLSAIKEGFTLITIGDGTTYRMIFGDALDAAIIKADGSPRDRDSSFRDDIVLNADRIFIEGEVETAANCCSARRFTASSPLEAKTTLNPTRPVKYPTQRAVMGLSSTTRIIFVSVSMPVIRSQ